ncbi:hypothetical protein ACBQ71_24945, partial [Escherichia coli]
RGNITLSKVNDDVSFGTCFRAAISDSHSLIEAKKRTIPGSFFLPFSPLGRNDITSENVACESP